MTTPQFYFQGWHSPRYDEGWADVFVRLIRPEEQLLPPAVQAQALQAQARHLVSLRPAAALWLQYDAPGSWYWSELRRALKTQQGMPVPLAVTVPRAGLIQAHEFRPPVRVNRLLPYHRPALATDGDLTPDEIRCLRVMGRLDLAETDEVAVLAGLPRPQAAEALAALLTRRWLAPDLTPGPPRWKLTRSGVPAALRSWGVPVGEAFTRRENFSPQHKRKPDKPKKTRARQAALPGVANAQSGNEGPDEDRTLERPGRDHKRVARTWNERVRAAWPQAQVWAGWSEVKLAGRTYPDGLAWGSYAGVETLFWLEVETGRAGPRVPKNILIRYGRAEDYLNDLAAAAPRLVFVVLGPPAAQRQAYLAFSGRLVPENMAVIIGSWQGGTLPVPRWGWAQSAG